MTLLTLFGAGLLVGAALIVILPEGMSVLYKSVEGLADMDSETINRYTGASLVFGFIVMLLIDQGFQVIQAEASPDGETVGVVTGRMSCTPDRKEFDMFDAEKEDNEH